MTVSFEQKTAINKRFQELYDAGVQSGRHGHYETMFGAMHTAYAESLATPVPGAVSNAMVERAARAVAVDHYSMRFNKPSDDPHVLMNVEGNWGIFAEDARKALEAAVQSPPIVWVRALAALSHEELLTAIDLATTVKDGILSIDVAAFRAALSSPAPVEAVATEPVAVCYTNWRGETAIREIRPLYMWFGATEWHPEPQWLITAVDIGKGVERDFALTGLGHPTGDSGALREALEWIAWEATIEQPLKDERRIMGRDDMILLARAALKGEPGK